LARIPQGRYRSNSEDDKAGQARAVASLLHLGKKGSSDERGLSRAGASARVRGVDTLGRSQRPPVPLLGGLLYDYDAAGRVIRMGGSLAKLDLPGAVSGKTYNASNQLTLPGYTYDRNGRLTSNGTQSYLWDARSQLTQITGATSAQFAYDALGRRSRKSINTAATQFLYDGPNLIQELSDASTPVVRATILTGLKIDEAFGRTQGTTKMEYLTDRLGSTITLSDASANLSTSYSYEPYGKITQSGVPDNNARAFTGREDDGAGLMYYRARYYDPAGGRFITEDPLGLFSGDTNPYRYVSSDPVNRVDPTGQYSFPLPLPPGPAVVGGAAAVSFGVGFGIGYLICRATGNPYCNPLTWFPPPNPPGLDSCGPKDPYR